MSKLVEAGLRLILSESAGSGSPSIESPRLPTWNGGKQLADLPDRDSLYRTVKEG